MSSDQPKPFKSDAAAEVERPVRLSSGSSISDQDMAHHSSRMDELRGNNPGTSWLPQLSFGDGSQNTGNQSGSQFTSDGSIVPNNGKLSGDSFERFQKLGKDLPDNPVSRAQDAFQRLETYEAPDGTTRVRPRQEEGPKRPGEVPPDVANNLRRITADMELRSPDETGKLPSSDDQTRLKQQAELIAGVIGANDGFDTGDQRAKIDSMFESATRDGKENLNFLVKSVNEELSKSRPDLQLKYSFDTESAWHTRDSHGAAIAYPTQEVKENHSTVGLVRNSTQQNSAQHRSVTSRVEDRVNSVGSMIPPGHVRTELPNRLQLLNKFRD
ncbi:MAG: hypothetical protein SGJ27_20735 [Candidatus Melainabacteria bacterium]|nr:hypothetical protein [Candidatus Melainabacteria bacterium]